MNSERKNVPFNEGLAAREFTVNRYDNLVVANEKTVDVQTLNRSLTERNTKERANFVETLQDRIQNAILAAVYNIIAPRIE